MLNKIKTLFIKWYVNKCNKQLTKSYEECKTLTEKGLFKKGNK